MPSSAVTVPVNANVITSLDLTAVSLCAAGANQRADILLLKSKKGNENMSFEELLASLKAEHKELIEKHIEEIKKTIPEPVVIEKEIIKEVPVTVTAPAEDEVFKSLPEAFRTRFEDMQKQIADLNEQRANELVEKNYQLCKAVPIEEKALKEILKAASPATIEALKAASAAVSAAVTKTTGTATTVDLKAGDANDAYDKLDKLAKSIQAANTNLSYETAFTRAIKENPSLYTDYLERSAI